MVHLFSHAVSRPEDRLRNIDSTSIPRFCHSKAKHARSAPHVITQTVCTSCVSMNRHRAALTGQLTIANPCVNNIY